MMASCFSVFAFLLPSADPVGSGPSTCSGRSPSDLFPIAGCNIARRDSELLKGDGKLKMTGIDGLRIHRVRGSDQIRLVVSGQGKAGGCSLNGQSFEVPRPNQ
jgi:hypothetical protein